MRLARLSVLVLALALSACRSVTSGSVEPIRIVPPADGECVGTVEVTIVNDGTSVLGVGRLYLLLPDERSDVAPPMGPPRPAFASFEPPWTGEALLEPGAARALTTTVVRTQAELSAPFDASARVPVYGAGDVHGEWKSPSARFDPAAWPVAEPLTKEAIDRAVAEGRGIRVCFFEESGPIGGVRMLDVQTDGSASGVAAMAFGTPEGDPIVGAGTMDAEQLAAFVAAVRAAPLDAFHADPKWRSSMDGWSVRLLVAAGRAACVLSSEEHDFRAAGLGPLLEQLRALIVALPRK